MEKKHDRQVKCDEIIIVNLNLISIQLSYTNEYCTV